MSRRKQAHHKLTKHHRKPTSIGGDHADKRNLSWVSDHQHQAYHAVVSNHSAPTICHILNEKWIDPDYRFICIRDTDFDEVMKILKERRFV